MGKGMSGVNSVGAPIFSDMAFFNPSRTGPVTIANSQGWVLSVEGARNATSRILVSTSFGTGSGRKALTLLRDSMASITSMQHLLSSIRRRRPFRPVLRGTKLPLRCPPFQPGHDTLDSIGPSHQVMMQLRLPAADLGRRKQQALPHEPLGDGHRKGSGVPGNVTGYLQCSGEYFL